MSLRVSVVVPVRNAAHEVAALLDALAAQDLPREQFEVLVADDASGDGTVAAVEEHPLGARVVRLNRWSGSYAARNAALAVASAPAVAFTDGDCRPQPGWLRRGLEELDRHEADLLAGHLEVPLSADPRAVELVDFCRYLDQERTLTEGGFGATANLIVRRPVLDALGGFRDGIISAGDADLCLRATAAGHRIAYSPAAVVVHEARTTAAGLARRGFRSGYARAQMRVRTPDTPVPLRQLWSAPGAWLPGALLGRSEVYGIERLATVGLPATRRLRLTMAWIEWTVVQLPRVLGNALGALRFALPRPLGDLLGRVLPA